MWLKNCSQRCSMTALTLIMTRLARVKRNHLCTSLPVPWRVSSPARAMCPQRVCQGKQVLLLIDSGRTRSIISSSVVKQLDLATIALLQWLSRLLGVSRSSVCHLECLTYPAMTWCWVWIGCRVYHWCGSTGQGKPFVIDWMVIGCICVGVRHNTRNCEPISLSELQ
jgi:hypothetical protein